MDKQIKQFTMEMQKLIGENKELKRMINKKNEEANNLQIKISELENKVSGVFKTNNINQKGHNKNINVSEMSFITNNGNISPSFLGGKGFNINTIGDLLKKQLIPKKENDVSDLSFLNITNNTNLNLNNNINNTNNVSNLINNRIIKIIRGGNKKKEVNFFKMLGNRNSIKEQDLIKRITTNKEDFEAINKKKMENDMKEFEDDASIF